MIDNLPAFHAPHQPDMHELDHQTPIPMWLARHLTPKMKKKKASSSTQASNIQNGIIFVITQRLDLVNGTFPFRWHTASWIMVCNVDDGLALNKFHRVFPIVPIIIVLDQEADQHAGIHFTHVQYTESSSMARVDVCRRILAGILVERQSRPGEVRIVVEEVGAGFVVIS